MKKILFYLIILIAIISCSSNKMLNDPGYAGAGLGKYDDTGDGVFGRRVVHRNLDGIFAANIASGKTIIKICIDRSGKVIFAEILESSEQDRGKKKKLLDAAYGYKYEPDPTAPEEQCGKLTIVADIRALRGIN